MLTVVPTVKKFQAFYMVCYGVRLHGPDECRPRPPIPRNILLIPVRAYLHLTSKIFQVGSFLQHFLPISLACSILLENTTGTQTFLRQTTFLSSVASSNFSCQLQKKLDNFRSRVKMEIEQLTSGTEHWKLNSSFTKININWTVTFSYKLIWKLGS
jgi:hypothetical protein